MRLLLDTHILLLATETESGTGALSVQADELIDDPRNSLLFSAASIWEVAIKYGLGRLEFRTDPHLLRRGLLNNGYIELPVTSAHAIAVAGLPRRHKNPFDRLLVAQAMVEGVVLMTADPVVAAYPGPIRKV